MAEITERFQFIVDMRQEIYVDGELADVNTGCYNSLSPDANPITRFVVDRDLFNDNAEAIQETENSGTDIIDAEVAEIAESLKKKGLTLNPNPTPVDPGSHGDKEGDDDSGDDDSGDDDSGDDNDGNDDDDSGGSSGSGHGTFTDPGNEDGDN